MDRPPELLNVDFGQWAQTLLPLVAARHDRFTYMEVAQAAMDAGCPAPKNFRWAQWLWLLERKGILTRGNPVWRQSAKRPLESFTLNPQPHAKDHP